MMTPYDNAKALKTAERLIQASDGGRLHSGMKDIVDLARAYKDLWIKWVDQVGYDDWYPYD